MPSSKSRLVVQKKPDVIRIEFLDKNILDEATIQQIGEEISALIEEAPVPKLLISFENVEHLSSAALGTLITINRKVQQKGGQLRLSNIDPQIIEVFKITRLDKLFKIYDNADKAMASFK